MRRGQSSSWLIASATLIGILGSSNAWANRTVRFSPSSSRVVISNSGSIAMSYTLTCNDSSGAQLVNTTVGSLNAGWSQIHYLNNGSPCTLSTKAPAAAFGDVALCNASSAIAYSSAASACGSHHRVCNLDDVKGTGAVAPSGSYWVQPYSSTFVSGSVSYNTSTAAPTIGVSSTSTCMDGITGAAVANCAQIAVGTSEIGTACCPTIVAVCAVAVTGDTGQLITPDFKNNTPF